MSNKGKQTSSSFWKTPGMTVVRNMLLAFVLFMLTRIIFFADNWELYSGHITLEMLWPMLCGSLRFDASALAYLCSLYVVLTLFPLHLKEKQGWYNFTRWTFIVLVFVGLVMNLIDCAYYPFSGGRLTIKVFPEFENDSNIGKIFFTETLNSWYLTAAGIACLVLLVWLTAKPQVKAVGNKLKYYIIRIPVFVIAAGLTVVAMRGGWGSSHPISMNNANQYVNRPVEAIGVLNTPFCFMRTIDKKPLKNPHYFSDSELDSIYTAVIQPADSDSVPEKRNVVVMILESFGAEYVGALNGTSTSYTPFLDSLINQSLCFSHGFANGRKSIDAMPSILSSLPMLGEDLFLSDASMNDMSGIAEELRSEGWQTAFFHGAENGSMGFQSFSRTTGYNDYYGLTEYCADPNYGGRADFDGIWAIWDEEFLQFMADRLAEMRQPFVASVFTASSHHPFAIPQRYTEVYPEEELPILKCVRYSDNALRQFFNKVSQMPWFENTLFVLTADHTNQSKDKLFQTEWGRFRIPIIFFDPKADAPRGIRDCIAQQADIMPTVLSWLGYGKPVVSFGNDLTKLENGQGRAFNYSNGIYQYIEGDSLLHFDGQNVTALFNYVKDPYLNTNLKDSEPATASRMSRSLKAVIQQYMSRMESNRLTIYH